jgi:hypothetical protein
MLALLLEAALLLPAAEPAPPVAMVLTTKRAVTLERGGDKPRHVGAMDLLGPGDRVRVPDGGEALLVFLGDGHRERLRKKGDVTVNETGCAPAGAVERLEGPRLPADSLRGLREMAVSGRGAVGVPRGEAAPTPQVVTPMFGATVLSDRPSLSWPAASGATGYRVELLSGAEGQDERVLWKAETKEPRLDYAAKEKPLRPGLKYRWRVAALLGDEKEERVVDNSKFLVATKREMEALAKVRPLASSKDPDDLVLAAATYEAYGAYGEALALYEKLAARFPDEANFQAALANYNERAGRPDGAKAAREKAAELRKK